MSSNAFNIQVLVFLAFGSFLIHQGAQGLKTNRTSHSDDAEEPPVVFTRCSSNSSTRLTFVTSLSVRGCPLFVHRLGEVKVGRFMLEPTFCLTDSSAIRSPNAHHDLLTSESYFSFPVNVTHEQVVSEAASMLSHLKPKSVSFLEVTSIRLNGTKSFAFKNASFLWGPTEFIGHLRLVCDGFNCQSLPFYLWRGQTEAFEGLRLEASMRVSEGCAPIKRTYPITIARSPLLPVSALQRERKNALPACSDLQLFRVVQLDNCTVFVHQRRGKKGHFVIEPLLCPTSNFSLLTDYSRGRHYLKLPAVVEDSSVVAAVRSEIASASPQSITFMKLWSAKLHVSAKLARWDIDIIRLSSDRKSAELRAYCRNRATCELLRSVLLSEPVNFWKSIQWSAKFVLDETCKFKPQRRRFAFRMKERPPNGVKMMTDGSRWTLDALRNRTVMRNGRSFIVVAQRGCKTSNFQRYWRDYVKGFGDNRNFWIGLDILHKLTSHQDATLRVEMLLWNDTEWFGEYSAFTVANSRRKYAMKYSKFIKSRSSLIYDALSASNGHYFSTRNVDNDRHSTANYCSRNWGGYAGWWYSACGKANPNGLYSFGDSSDHTRSVWYFVEGFKALKEFRMMLQV